MSDPAPDSASPPAPALPPGALGPWLVGLGAALWGTESLWRIPLNNLLSADVIVFWEHVLLLLGFLPIILRRRHELRKIRLRPFAYLLFSGVSGSAVGTVCFTAALKHGNPTVVNLVLNIQPVFSTAFAVLLFSDRLAPRFFLWAPLAICAGIALSIEHPDRIISELQTTGLQTGTALALLCALCWGLSTVAGRGAMLGMSIQLGSALRVLIGLLCMAVILAVRHKLSGDWLWPAAVQRQAVMTVGLLIGLVSISGGIPLLIYFAGLQRTRASTAGYFEMMQTLAALIITWGYFGAALRWHQILTALALLASVAMVQREQRRIGA